MSKSDFKNLRRSVRANSLWGGTGIFPRLRTNFRAFYTRERRQTTSHCMNPIISCLDNSQLILESILQRLIDHQCLLYCCPLHVRQSLPYSNQFSSTIWRHYHREVSITAGWLGLRADNNLSLFNFFVQSQLILIWTRDWSLWIPFQEKKSIEIMMKKL